MNAKDAKTIADLANNSWLVTTLEQIEEAARNGKYILELDIKTEGFNLTISVGNVQVPEYKFKEQLEELGYIVIVPGYVYRPGKIKILWNHI